MDKKPYSDKRCSTPQKTSQERHLVNYNDTACTLENQTNSNVAETMIKHTRVPVRVVRLPE
ncbi:MAG: hypothetical protein CSA22_08495 [Deltaproteobacteria bacterium]|nr:MAG: hypothetical protein CSA22_08495 [Deltaproteobacteria bacterium]